jgi:hypothetical protein
MPQGGARSTSDVGCGITDHGIGRYRPTPPTGPTQTTPRTVGLQRGTKVPATRDCESMTPLSPRGRR